jgi:hypothetical protein
VLGNRLDAQQLANALKMNSLVGCHAFVAIDQKNTAAGMPELESGPSKNGRQQLNV